ncbi:MAG: leucine-rich repeat protein [Lachnospiraceae bacterium]|nr:leucine-rich repeat protein [Lachnospiraceae bacterium]
MDPKEYLTPKKFLACCNQDKKKCTEQVLGSYLGEPFLNLQIYKEGSTFDTFYIAQTEDVSCRFFMDPKGRSRRSIPLDRCQELYTGIDHRVLHGIVDAIDRRLEQSILPHPDFQTVFANMRERGWIIDPEAEADLLLAKHKKDSVLLMILLLAAIFQDYYSGVGICRKVRYFLEQYDPFKNATPSAVLFREKAGNIPSISPISDLKTNQTYVRRGDLLDEAEKKLGRLENLGEKRFLLFYGAPGDGKSELARAYAREYEGRKYREEFWLTCPHGDEQLSLTSLCCDGASGYSSVELLDILTNAPSDVLLVIDNCNVQINALINELYYHTGDATVIITSRLSNLSGFDQRNALQVLSEKQDQFCLEVFRRNYEKKQIAGTLRIKAEELAAAEEICQRVYLNPLFISMIASFLREHASKISIRDFNRKLSKGLLEAFPKYSQLDFRKDAEESIRMEPRDVLQVILSEELNCIRVFAEEERQIMHLMILFPAEPLSQALVSEILGDNEEQFLMDSVIDRLQGISLLQKDGSQIMIHPLVCELIQSGVLMDNGVPILYDQEERDRFYSHILQHILLFDQKKIRDCMHIAHMIFSAIHKPDPALCLLFYAYYDKKEGSRYLAEASPQLTEPFMIVCWDTLQGKIFKLWNLLSGETEMLLDLSRRRKAGRYYKNENPPFVVRECTDQEEIPSEAVLLLFYEGRRDSLSPLLIDLTKGIQGHEILAIPDLFMRNTRMIFQIRLPENLKRIGDWAFDNCKGLTGTLELPDSLEVIGKGAFNQCAGLTGGLHLPENLRVLDEMAFCYCDNLQGQVHLPDHLEVLGDLVFCMSRGLTGQVKMPSSLRELGEKAFYNCCLDPEERFLALMRKKKREEKKKRREIYISPVAERIENEAFYGRSDLGGVLKLPLSLQSIGDQAFYQCSRITGSLSFPSSLKRIGLGAFFGCSMLKGEVDLPDSLEELGEGAFFGCSGLEGPLRLSRSIKKIPSAAFFLCTGLTSISNIENLSALREIGMGAFFNCVQLKGDLYLPENLERIDDGAFDCCSGITNIFFSRSGKLRELGQGSFSRCSGIKGTIRIPISVESVGRGCFQYCGVDTCIVMSRDTILHTGFVDPSVKIVGFEGSTAEDYARKFGNPFVVLE